MAKKVRDWADKHPREMVAAANLRIAGVSERAIYERFQDMLVQAPSYRDLRAGLAEFELRYRAGATTALHEKRGFKFDRPTESIVPDPEFFPTYKSRLEAQFGVKEFKQRLDRNFAAGYLLAQGIDTSSLKDPDLINYLESEYEGPS